MAVVTVTGGANTSGANQPAISLTFDAGRTQSEAVAVRNMIFQQFGGKPATVPGTPTTYVDAAHNLNGEQAPVGATMGQGYVVIEATTASPDYVNGFEAVTVTTAATVFGGASDGQLVLSQGNLTYGTTFGGGTIVLGGSSVTGGTTNTVGLYTGGNTVYGGNGSDTINILPQSGVTFDGTSANVVYAGDGATRVNMRAASGVASVVGSAKSASATLYVDAASSASTVDGGLGTLTEDNAAGTVFGGLAGHNVITGSTTAAATITGGGASDLLQGFSAGTVITTADDDGSIVNVSSGDETVNGGSGTTTVNVGGTGGFIVINGGDGASTINVGNNNQSTIQFTAGSGDVDYFGSSVSGSSAVITAGAGMDFIQAGAGNTTLIAGTGDSRLNVGAGSDSIVGSTTANGTFGFTAEAANQQYYIDNFHVGDIIYVADQTAQNYILDPSHQVVNGTTLTVSFQNGATVALSNTTTQLTSTDIKHL